ncbi:unnamed protein product [Spirodela intermedia]|uniref:Uncharacterized protein n=1 Tax=Spirodela intermedia TaxID=51605 RepID=A0A7I8KFJ1_SPIIN|nr:unnamed protein product [Spirodela intermedia]
MNVVRELFYFWSSVNGKPLWIVVQESLITKFFYGDDL